MRLVLLAVDRADAHDWLASQPWPPKDVTVTTRRSPAACHGITADIILATTRALGELPDDVYLGMLNAAMPCVMARR